MRSGASKPCQFKDHDVRIGELQIGDLEGVLIGTKESVLLGLLPEDADGASGETL